MQRIFLSDLHLDDPLDRVFSGFAACLETESTQVDEIYILGDLVEMWIGDDDNSPIALALTELLTTISKRCPRLSHAWQPRLSFCFRVHQQNGRYANQ